MSYARQMTDTHPGDAQIDLDLLAACIDACFDCAQACTACADACLAEDAVQDMVRCISSDAVCADLCEVTGRVLTRRTEADREVQRALLQACAAACRTCGDECAEHGEMGMEHCRICAEACRRCEQACNDLLAAIGG